MRRSRPGGRRGAPSAALVAACAAAVLALLYAAVSAYWGAGGTALLDTVGGTIERHGRELTTSALVIVWATVVVKLAAGAIGLWAVGPAHIHARSVRVLAWIVAAVLVAYGGVLTLVGLGVQLGLVRRSPSADERALRWHAFLWDPWFLLWGALLAIALVLSRRGAVRNRSAQIG